GSSSPVNHPRVGFASDARRAFCERFMKRFLFAILCSCAAAVASAQEYPQFGADIYNTRAEAAPAIGEALKIAKRENKHVLLDFGASGCGWCARLHELFTTSAEVSACLRQNFIAVLVDVNTRTGPARNAEVVNYYGDPTKHGLPVLLVLDPSGRVLTTRETGALESGSRHDPAKVMAFLRRWAPTE